MKIDPSSQNYTRSKELVMRVDDREIKVISKPGLPNWDQLTPSAYLIAKYVDPPRHSKALMLGCGHGCTSVILSNRLSGGRLWMMDINLIALQMTKQTLAANEIKNATINPAISVLPEQADYFDTIIIDLPKSRILARRWLCEAFSALTLGGKLFLAGAKQSGVKSAIKDAHDLFGNSAIIAYKKGNRISVSTKRSTQPQLLEWAQQNGIAFGTWHRLKVDIPPRPLNIASLPGIFSYDRIDQGTKMLIPHIQVSPGEKVLDLGCGYGILGIVASLAGECSVDLIDVNLLAIAATQKNLDENQIHNARALPSDVLGAIPDDRFDKVFSNPPFHAGTAINYQMANAFIYQSFQALNPGGILTLVANKFIRYDQIMTDFFSTVKIADENARYHVLRGIRT